MSGEARKTVNLIKQSNTNKKQQENKKNGFVKLIKSSSANSVSSEKLPPQTPVYTNTSCTQAIS